MRKVKDDRAKTGTEKEMKNDASWSVLTPSIYQFLHIRHTWTKGGLVVLPGNKAENIRRKMWTNA